MGFSLSGSTITQTGTDADLSGLLAIAGVNAFSAPNGKAVYDLNTNSLNLEVSGDLTIDGDVEELHCNESADRSLQVNSGAVLRVGKQKNVGGQTRYSQGLAIVQPRSGADQFRPDGIVFLGTADFQWNGGVIMSANPMGPVVGQLEVTATINAGTFLCTSPANNAMFFRSDGTPDKVVVNSATLDHVDPSAAGVIVFARNGLDVISFDMRCGFIQERSGSTTGGLIVRGGKFASNAFTYDYQFNGGNVGSSNGTEFINLDVGTGLRFDPGLVMAAGDTGHVGIFQELNVTLSDINGSPLEGARLYVPTTDSGNRVDLAAGDVPLQNGRTFGGGALTYDLYNALSDSSGVVATQSILTGRFWTASGSLDILQDLYSVSQTPGTDDFQLFYISYNELISSQTVTLRGSAPTTINRTLLPDTSITQSDKAVVDAYPSIDTSAQLYDRAKSYLFDNYAGEIEPLLLRNNQTIEAGSYDIVIDATASPAFAVTGNTITLRSSSFVGDITTTGTVSSANGAVIEGFIQDSAGNAVVAFAGGTSWEIFSDAARTLSLATGVVGLETYRYIAAGQTFYTTVTLSNGDTADAQVTDQGAGTTSTVTTQSALAQVTGNRPGSRLQVFNVTTSTEIFNDTADYTETYIDGTTFSEGDIVRIRVTYQSGFSADEPIDTTAVASAGGWSVLVTPTSDPVYTSYGIDGSLETDFIFDQTNIQIDVSATAGQFQGRRLYSWYKAEITTAAGISDLFGGLSAVDEGNVKIDPSVVDLRFDNPTTTNAYQTDTVRFFRADGGRPVAVPTSGGGGLDINWQVPVLTIEAGSGLSPSEQQQLATSASQATRAADNALAANIQTKQA